MSTNYIELFKSLAIENKYSKTYLKLMTRASSRKDPIEYFEKHHIVPDCLFIKSRAKETKGFLIEKSNHKNNLVKLTAKEHYVAHHLLCYCFDSEIKYKMFFAFSYMCSKSKTNSGRSFSANQYEISKRFLSKARKNTKMSIETRQKISNSSKIRFAEGEAGDAARKKISSANKGRVSWNKGKSGYLTEEARHKISTAVRQPRSIETRQKISLANIGKVFSDETKKKISENHSDVSGKNNPMYGKKMSEDAKMKAKATKLRNRKLKGLQ